MKRSLILALACVGLSGCMATDEYKKQAVLYCAGDEGARVYVRNFTSAMLNAPIAGTGITVEAKVNCPIKKPDD